MHAAAAKISPPSKFTQATPLVAVPPPQGALHACQLPRSQFGCTNGTLGAGVVGVSEDGEIVVGVWVGESDVDTL